MVTEPADKKGMLQLIQLMVQNLFLHFLLQMFLAIYCLTCITMGPFPKAVGAVNSFVPL